MKIKELMKHLTILEKAYGNIDVTVIDTEKFYNAELVTISPEIVLEEDENGKIVSVNLLDNITAEAFY